MAAKERDKIKQDRLQRRRDTWKKKKSLKGQEELDDDEEEDSIDEPDDMDLTESERTELEKAAATTNVEPAPDKETSQVVTSEQLFGSTSDMSSSESSNKESHGKEPTNVEMEVDQVCFAIMSDKHTMSTISCLSSFLGWEHHIQGEIASEGGGPKADKCIASCRWPLQPCHSC